MVPHTSTTILKIRISRQARVRCGFAELQSAAAGHVVLGDIHSVRVFPQQINEERDLTGNKTFIPTSLSSDRRAILPVCCHLQGTTWLEIAQRGCFVVRDGSVQVSVEGLEPSTNGLKGHCSAIELHAH
jgi:hypothetical protein